MTNYLFIHQHAPGQWKHIAQKLAQDPANRVVFLCTRSFSNLKNVQYAFYEAPDIRIDPDGKLVKPFIKAHKYGVAAAERMEQLKQGGFIPDVVCCHPGWGEGLFVKDVFPHATVLCYAEAFSDNAIIYPYTAYEARLQRKPNAPDPFTPEVLTLEGRMRVRTTQAHLLLTFEEADHFVTPTHWQFSQHPKFVQERMEVIHEGINTAICRPKADVNIQMPNGHVLNSGDEIITYLGRNLEPARGFPTFIYALPEILQSRPNAHIVVMGGEGQSYGHAPKEGGSWKEKFLKEVQIDQSRVHFIGFQPYNNYLALLRLSSVHIYLTYPFVLSWSMLEAMACECLLIGSATPPVQEVIIHGKNGLLVDFFSSDDLAQQVIEVLARPEEFTHLRKAARQTIIDHYDLHTVCLPKMEAFLQQVGA